MKPTEKIQHLTFIFLERFDKIGKCKVTRSLLSVDLSGDKNVEMYRRNDKSMLRLQLFDEQTKQHINIQSKYKLNPFENPSSSFNGIKSTSGDLVQITKNHFALGYGRLKAIPTQNSISYPLSHWLPWPEHCTPTASVAARQIRPNNTSSPLRATAEIPPNPKTIHLLVLGISAVTRFNYAPDSGRLSGRVTGQIQKSSINRWNMPVNALASGHHQSWAYFDSGISRKLRILHPLSNPSLLQLRVDSHLQSKLVHGWQSMRNWLLANSSPLGHNPF